MSDEPIAVIFFEMVNKAGNATIHVTLKTAPGENEYDLIARVGAFAKTIDPTASTEFLFKDAPKPSYQRGGKVGGKVEEIKDNKFAVTALARAESPKKDKPGQSVPQHPNWSYLEAYGEQDGQEIKVRCFIGDPGWVTDKNAIAPRVNDLLPNFFAVPAGQRIEIQPGFVALVQKNTQFHNYDLLDVVPV